MDVAGEAATESSLPGPCVCVQGGCAGGFVQNATLHFASPFADGRSGAGYRLRGPGAGYRLRGPELVFAEKVAGGAPQGGYGPFAAGRNPGLWYRSVTFAPTPAPSPAPVVVGAPEVSIVDAGGVPLSQVVLRVADDRILWDSANVAQFKTDYFGSSGAPHSAPGTYFYDQVFSGAPGTTVMSTSTARPPPRPTTVPGSRSPSRASHLALQHAVHTKDAICASCLRCSLAGLVC